MADRIMSPFRSKKEPLPLFILYNDQLPKTKLITTTEISITSECSKTSKVGAKTEIKAIPTQCIKHKILTQGARSLDILFNFFS